MTGIVGGVSFQEFLNSDHLLYPWTLQTLAYIELLLSLIPLYHVFPLHLTLPGYSEGELSGKYFLYLLTIASTYIYL